MDSAAAYWMFMHRLLAAASELFPTERLTTAPGATGAPEEPPTAGAGLSGMSAGAADSAERYRETSAGLAAVTERINDAAAAASTRLHETGLAAAGLADDTASQAGTMASAMDSPEGIGHLASTMDQRLAAMQNHIMEAREQAQLAYVRLGEAASEASTVGPPPTE